MFFLYIKFAFPSKEQPKFLALRGSGIFWNIIDSVKILISNGVPIGDKNDNWISHGPGRDSASIPLNFVQSISVVFLISVKVIERQIAPKTIRGIHGAPGCLQTETCPP